MNHRHLHGDPVGAPADMWCSVFRPCVIRNESILDMKFPQYAEPSRKMRRSPLLWTCILMLSKYMRITYFLKVFICISGAVGYVFVNVLYFESLLFLRCIHHSKPSLVQAREHPLTSREVDLITYTMSIYQILQSNSIILAKHFHINRQSRIVATE